MDHSANQEFPVSKSVSLVDANAGNDYSLLFTGQQDTHCSAKKHWSVDMLGPRISAWRSSKSLQAHVYLFQDSLQAEKPLSLTLVLLRVYHLGKQLRSYKWLWDFFQPCLQQPCHLQKPRVSQSW